jgi:hypothetical protein
MLVLLHIINITLITIVLSNDNKFEKSYGFDLIFITEYFFFNSVIKKAFYNDNNYCIFSHLTIFRARGAKICTLHSWGWA